MRPVVRNAANPAQINEVEKAERRGREQELNDMRFILKSREGRRFLWRLLGHCKTFGSVWEPSARIHYLSGQQDVGHFLLGEITHADQDAYFNMMREAQQEK